MIDGVGEPVVVGKPRQINRTKLNHRLDAIFERNWFSNRGPFAQELEQRICEITGAKYCYVTCNATTALQVLAKAMGLSGEVIVPSFTFHGTAHAFDWIGLEVRFCDVSRVDGNIDLSSLRDSITEKTSAIVGVHLWGNPCDTFGLVELANEADVLLLIDGAQSFGATVEGSPVGGCGVSEIVSFHATKIVSAFEGGAILTDNPELSEKIHAMHNFGFDTDKNVVSSGTNAKMHEVSAAMALTYLDDLGDILTENRGRFEIYKSRLKSVPGIRLIEAQHGRRGNLHYVSIVVEGNTPIAHVRRSDIKEALARQNIFTRTYFAPGCHKLRPYNQLHPDKIPSARFPNTEALAESALSLPTGGAVSDSQIHLICDIIESAASKHRRSSRSIPIVP
ncbi:aminotransferase class V-fold PLP-dependent enzyme [Pseudonocardia acaciae]|uniref:aminotransferase class V-fold PLP-dependent enzyme n=1 Tax=Pseudonocardia acaciae TaxID=551276 RepID=UPI00146FF77D|nr:aminotransferase class V-fold PLP-dependent enzyme [Pseudonocardia acaciae]